MYQKLTIYKEKKDGLFHIVVCIADKALHGEAQFTVFFFYFKKFS